LLLHASATAATAPHANLAEIGVIFNDVASQILGGVNADNATVISNDVNAIITDMQALMTANPMLFGGLTGVHAEAVVRQLELENAYIAQAGISPDAGRASNDNILDIIDIVQGDTNLANMANQGGVSGFTPFGDALNPTPKYLDNDAQTNFWANFMGVDAGGYMLWRTPAPALELRRLRYRSRGGGKLAANYSAFLKLASIRIWLRTNQSTSERTKSSGPKGPLRVVSGDDRYCLLAGALSAGAAGRLVAAPVVVPGWLLLRGVTSRMPGGAAGLAGCVCAVWLGGVVPAWFTVVLLRP
jgi:hypothetical protein